MFDKQLQEAVAEAHRTMRAVVAQKTIKDPIIDPNNWLPVNRITRDEFYNQAGYVLQQHVKFTPEQASDIFKAYPELLTMKQPKAYMTLEETLQTSLLTLLLNSRADEISQMALDLYQDMTLADVIDVFERAIALWEKLPQQTMFRDDDPDPNILSIFAEHFQEDTTKEVHWVGDGYLNEKILINEAIEAVDRWVRVLALRTPEAKAMARELQEARQLLVFVKGGEIALDDVKPKRTGPTI